MPISSGGKKGRSGRKGMGLEIQIGRLKERLLIAIERDCNKSLKRELFWAEKFVNRLMPQEITGGGGEPIGIILYPEKKDEIKTIPENFVATPIQTGNSFTGGV